MRNGCADGTGKFFAGIWRSCPGARQVSYTENERCVLTDGRVRITDTNGDSWNCGPRDCFVMAAGFVGLQEVLELARKFYAICEPPSSRGVHAAAGPAIDPFCYTFARPSWGIVAET